MLLLNTRNDLKLWGKEYNQPLFGLERQQINDQSPPKKVEIPFSDSDTQKS